MSAVNVAHHRADIAAQQQQQAEEEQKTDEEKQQEKEEADPDLTDTQRKAIDNYDDDTKAFIETLSASVWSANNGTDTLQFTGHTYTETVNGKATEHTYAVTRLEKGTDTAGMEIDTAVFETDTGTHVIRYTCQTGTGEVTDTLSATLSSGTAFQLQDTDYVRQNPVQNITVEGLNDEITALLGGADTLTSELSKWCAAYYPTASTASWTGITVERCVEHHHHRVHPDHRGYRPRFRHRNRIRNLPPCGRHIRVRPVTGGRKKGHP